MSTATIATSETPVFQWQGDHWAILHDGVTIRLRDTLGMRYLAHPVAHPHERIAATELLATATGPSGNAGERARWAVSKRIHVAIARIRKHHPTLGSYLRSRVRIGRECSFTPGPNDGEPWRM